MKSVKYFKLILLTILLILCSIAIQPNKTYAGDTYTITANESVLDTGKNTNAKIKKLVNHNATYNMYDSSFTNIKWVDEPFTSTTNLAIQGKPVYARLNDTVVELYTEATTVYLNEDSSYLFCCFAGLTNIDFIYTKCSTNYITNFSYMFYSCKKLTSLDLSTWNVSNVTTFKNMFKDCEKLTTLNLTNWQVTNKCTDLSYMFYSCENLESFTCDFTTWDVSNVSSFEKMFSYCKKLATLDLTDWQVSNKCTTLSYMFYKCEKLVSIGNLSAWDVSNVTSFCSMFSNCMSLTALKLNNWQVTNKCTDLSFMFYKCNNLETLICDFTTWNTSNITDFSYMFADCWELPSLDLSTWDVSNVTDFNKIFSCCYKLTSLDLSSWRVSNKCTDLSSMFDTCQNLETLNCDFTTWNVSNINTFASMFMRCEKLTELNLSNWNISNGTDFSRIFEECKQVITLDLTSWQVTNKCTELYWMFGGCGNLKTLICDFTTWDVSNVTSFNAMFKDCVYLINLDISNFNINNASLSYMFDNCWRTQHIKLPQVATVTNLNHTFSSFGADNIEIDLSNWIFNFQDSNSFYGTFDCIGKATIKLPEVVDFSKCTTFLFTFRNADSLTSLPECFKQPNLDLTNIIEFTGMFQYSGLTSVDLSNWITSNKTESYACMFESCSDLTEIHGLNSLNTEGLSMTVSYFYRPLNGMFRDTKITDLDISDWNILLSTSFWSTFPETLEKIKMCNTSNISEDDLKDLFKNNMVLDNDEDGIGDDSVLRKDAIKDVNSTDKQIYIKYVPQPSTLVSGPNFSAKVKSLVTPSATYATNDTTITSIEWSDVAPADGVTTVKVSESGTDIIGYLDETVVKLYTTVDTVYLNEDSSFMFYNFQALESLPMSESKLDTSNVTDFSQMFKTCLKLTTLDLHSWQVTNKCTDLNNMFNSCSSLESISCDFTTWNVSNVTDFSFMFYNCQLLTTLNLSTWDISNGITFLCTFEKCKKLTTLDLSNWQVTDKCTDLGRMFVECYELVSLTCDFTTWDISNVTNFSYMFSHLYKLPTLDLSGWQVTNKCTNLSYMFNYDRMLNLTCDFTTWNVSNVTKFDCMFCDCQKLTTLNLTNWQVTDKCTNLSRMFVGCYNLEALNCDFNSWNVSNVTDFNGMFQECQKLTELDLSGWQVTNKCTDLSGMFRNCNKLETIVCNFNAWDVSNISSNYKFSFMFYNTKIKELDISNWNITIEYPFYYTFPSTLEKLKMCNTSNISEDNLKNLFSNDMMLDNNEDGVSDDNVARRNAIKDVNTTDKQIYIKYVAPTYSVLTTGPNFNAKIKSLVSPSATSDTYDTTITSIEWTTVEPADGVTTKKVSESGADVVGYLDGTVIKLYTTVDTVYLNADCHKMFYALKAVETLPVVESKIDSSNVTNFDQTFYPCYKLTTLDLSSWQVSNKCTNFYGMFCGCQNLETLICDFTTWDVSNITSFSYIFKQCEKLTSLNLSTWDVSNSITFYSMFDNCNKLDELNLTGWQVTNKCTDLSSMFKDCHNLSNLTCDFTTWDVSNVTDFSQMFRTCSKLTTLDLTNWQVTNKCTNLSVMFCSCHYLETLTCDFTTWDVSNVTTFSTMFQYCWKLTALNISGWQVSNKCTRIDSMFEACSMLESLTCDFTTWDVSNVTNFSYMFSQCKKLTTLDLSIWDVSNGTNFYNTFSSCTALTSLDISNWKVTNKCTTLGSMFKDCKNLEILNCNFNTWDVSNVIGFDVMFYNCKKLTSLDLNNWQVTDKCKNLCDMFAYCENLETLTCNFNSWDVSNVTSFYTMFNGCKKLTSLDLSSWQVTTKCTSLTRMFNSCNNLEKVKLFNTYNISSENMLKNLFSYDMILDNNEDNIGDDTIIRRTVIKDVNTTDKQIYIRKRSILTFNLNGGTYNGESEYILYLGNSVIVPNSMIPIPEKSNYTFEGYYNNLTNTASQIDFTQVITSDKTVYAKYKINQMIKLHLNDELDSNGNQIGDSDIMDIPLVDGKANITDILNQCKATTGYIPIGIAYITDFEESTNDDIRNGSIGTVNMFDVNNLKQTYNTDIELDFSSETVSEIHLYLMYDCHKLSIESRKPIVVIYTDENGVSHYITSVYYDDPNHTNSKDKLVFGF